MSLFLHSYLFLHSGEATDFKIECDALDDEDINTLAHQINKKIKFSDVKGIPSGGDRLAKALKKYITPNAEYPLLIVDDVLTTGGSFRTFRSTVMRETGLTKHQIIGVTIFCRKAENLPDWVMPIFTMW